MNHPGKLCDLQDTTHGRRCTVGTRHVTPHFVCWDRQRYGTTTDPKSAQVGASDEQVTGLPYAEMVRWDLRRAIKT
ncbi:MAG: hypothetical protein QOJ29_2340 [Thermoleophilaceae bacterium]|jgi:hypothetical protein|nr:hypothetical protein [Thermoleophilaceae bacterium]